MFTTLARIIKYGFQNFWRNGLVSFATILVLLLAVIVFQGMMLFGEIGRQAINAVQDKIDISVYFVSNAPEDEILKLKEALLTLSEVKSVDYISKEEALELFRERHADDPTISQAIEELEENPLRASLNIKAQDPNQYSLIAGFLEGDASQNIIQEVSYSQNQVVIDRLAKVLSLSRRIGVLLTLVCATVAIIISFNTILLAIYSNKEEIAIMRLVGASNAFIRGPYIIVGIVYGIIAVLAAMIIMAPFIYAASPYISVFITDMNLWGFFLGSFFKFLGYNLLFGVGIGVISSVIVIRKYLEI
ncbi:MAG TPA: permease-like cell division protein FtsX [Candidatus Colwellbacteria bacterium]|mgnify:FL=1|nr:permease-like cell division protein FtsX [Candidatus Colwellbacteria bacterium]